MTVYIGGSKIKDVGEYGVYLGSPNTNCLTYTPKNINLELSNGTLTLKAGSKVYVPNGYDTVKYYKYTYSAWTQPVLSANGTLGGNSFAVASDDNTTYPAWKAFNKDTTYANNNACISKNVSSGFLSWYNPTPIKITNVQVMNYVANRTVKGYKLQGSNDNSVWVDLASGTNTVTTQQGIWNISIANNKKAYKYHRIYVTSATGSEWGICTLTITAQQQTGSVESTSADYDYTVGTGQMKFDEVVIESDIVATNYTGYTFTALACYVPELNKVLLDGAYTGSGNGFEYNTEENYLRLAGSYTDTTWTGKLTALPLGLIEMTSAVGATSIIQTFDWCGYIGSTVFVLPKVKGLIPNGFNADGTYKSIEFENTTVAVNSLTVDGNFYLRAAQNETGFFQKTTYHDKSINRIIYNGVGQTRMLAGEATISSGVITSLTPYTAQSENTYIPIKEIYNGSQLVYQINSFEPGTVLVYAANTGTKTFSLGKGVYKVALCGARGKDVTTVAGGYAWGNAGSGGGFVEVLFYVPEKTTVTLYSTSQGNGASYMNFGSTRMITANGGADGAGAAGTCSVSSSLDVVETIKNVTGNKGGTALASTPNVATVSTYGNWGSTANSSGGVRLEYIRLKR